MERIELVKLSCGHRVPRPAGWEELEAGRFLTLQAALDHQAELVGTPYFEVVEVPGAGRVRVPVTNCPRCESDLRAMLDADDPARGRAQVTPLQ